MLVSPIAYFLRDLKIDSAKNKASMLEIGSSARVKSKEQILYFNKVCDLLKKYTDEFTLRVENPRLNLYSNNVELIEKLSKIDEYNVKFVAMPNSTHPELVAGSIIVKRLDFDYKVSIAATRNNHSNFVEWAKNNPKIRMPKKCLSDLSKDRSWGGGYFYVKDAKTLTMVKMFLGSIISKVETVVKA